MILDILRKHFGLKEFQGVQEEVIKQILSGQDVFISMPTGGGKSLCYQLPALCFAGLTIVISPLIALMKDQVDGLKAKGIHAEFLNSTLNNSEAKAIKDRIVRGDIKILYLSPERLSHPGFIKFLMRGHVSLIAIDEAHCISQWGHDFRPDYMKIKAIRQIFPDAGMVALTATATTRVRQDIIDNSGLKEPIIFISTFDRPNLFLRIIKSKEPFENLIFLLGDPLHKNGSIIYCHSRKNTVDMAESLRLRGFNAEAYHAGLSPIERSQLQERFLKNKTKIITATNAFGMGIDKPDVRMVVHFCVPPSLEAYYQEIGRAGRDGGEGHCFLFFDNKEVIRHIPFIEKVEDPKQEAILRVQLESMRSFCETNKCRRQVLLKYFGERYSPNNCRNCDNCTGEAQKGIKPTPLIPF